MRNHVFIALLLTVFVSAAPAAEPPPFEINMDRVEVNHKGTFADSKTYFIPTIYLRIAAKTTTSVRNKSASAKMRVFTEGLDKAMLQSLAKKIYDDLVAKVRAAGFTVLTYDDLKADLVTVDRMQPNPKFGFPTKFFALGSPIEFAIVAPSDEQTLDWGSAWPITPYQGIAKGKKVVVLVPEVYFTLPEVWATKESNSMFDKAGVNFAPTMKLFISRVWGLPPSLGGCYILVQAHDKRLAAEVAGSMRKVAGQNNKYGDWSQAVGDYDFVLDPAAFSTGILRVGYALNDLTAKTIKSAQH